MMAKQIRRDLLDAAHGARADDDDERFHRVWNRFNRLEQALYDVEEWESELNRLSDGHNMQGSFMPEIFPAEQLRRFGELERYYDDAAMSTRIERVRQTRCFCDGFIHG